MNANPVQLIYVDQNDDLSSKDNLKLVQTAIQEQNTDALHAIIINWYIEQENDNIDRTLKEENPELDIDLLLDDSNQRHNHALEVDGSLRETVCECRHYRAYVCEVVPITFLKAFIKDGQRVPHTSIEAF